jgi:hypothetical protein
VELAERREPSGVGPLGNRRNLANQRSACALPLTLIQRHSGRWRIAEKDYFSCSVGADFLFALPQKLGFCTLLLEYSRFCRSAV